jgi:hypothetical protein
MIGHPILGAEPHGRLIGTKDLHELDAHRDHEPPIMVGGGESSGNKSGASRQCKAPLMIKRSQDYKTTLRREWRLSQPWRRGISPLFSRES